MGVTLHVDTRGFNAAIRKLAAVSRSDSDKVVNRAAMMVAAKAIEITRHAERGEIERLRQIAQIITHGKRGKRLKKERVVYAATPQSLLIYLKQQWTEGKNPRANGGSRADLMQKAARMVSKRISSINWVRSGWSPAVKKLATAIGRGTRTGLPSGRVGKGDASPSTGGRGTAIIWNESLTNKGEKPSPAMIRFAEEGLRRALDYGRQRLIEFARKNLEERARQFNSGGFGR